MTNGNDDKFRSRKWILACRSLVTATVVMVLVEVLAAILAWRGVLPAAEYRQSAVAVLYWWLFCDLGVLGGYGIPNVIEKWSPKGGGS
jgi:hypothetical protein